MAKRTSTDDQQPTKPTYSDADIAEFVTALESDSTDATPEEPAPSKGERKIQVVEEGSTGRRKRPSVEAPGVIEQAFSPAPPEEMKHLTRSKRHFPWGWVISIVALLAAVSIGGFLFFNRTQKFSNANVQVQFRTMADAASGGSYTFVIEYQNNEPVDLTNVELTIAYPDGFTYVSSTPTAIKEFNNAFPIGSIRSGQSGTVSVTGTLIGAVGDTKDFSATLTYRPSNFNSEFQQKATAKATIGTSILSLKVAGPTQLAPGATGSWTVTYQNTSDHDLKNVQLTATYPDGFTVTSTKPTADERSSIWRLNSIGKGATGTMTISGIVDGALGDTLPLKVSAGLIGANATVDAQAEESLLILLVKTGVTTSVAVNGSTSPATVKPGEVINYLVRVTNSSDVELSDVSLKVKLDGTALDMAKLANDSKGKVTDTTLTWTKEQLAALASLKPAQVVTVSFAVGTQTTLTVKSDADRNPNVTATIDVTAPGLATNTNAAAIPSTVVVTKISSIFSLDAEARYYNDQNTAVGSGPVVPTVGKTTTYRVIWTVTNTTSDASSMTVSARLPNTVLWTGKNLSRDAGDLVFDADTRTVRWTLNTVPAGTGSRLPALKAYFEVSITPTAEQVGTVPVLIESASATATDSYSGVNLTGQAPTLSTDLPNDPKVNGTGEVVSG